MFQALVPKPYYTLSSQKKKLGVGHRKFWCFSSNYLLNFTYYLLFANFAGVRILKKWCKNHQIFKFEKQYIFPEYSWKMIKTVNFPCLMGHGIPIWVQKVKSKSCWGQGALWGPFTKFILKAGGRGLKIIRKLEKIRNLGLQIHFIGVILPCLIGPSQTYVNQAVKEKDVCILFNNVAEFQHEAFADTSIETIFRASNVNCHAQAILSQFFLKKLISR